jgi:ADP-heptose:LPS heptosyltransferase
MNVLIIKLNATGDVVRTTPLLRCLQGEFTWVTARNNLSLLQGITPSVRAFTWEERDQARDRSYDLVISLEDEIEVGRFVEGVRYRQLFGAYLNREGKMAYTADSKEWFDLSLISQHGKAKADQLKLQNRATYQAMIFRGLGLSFEGQKYILPEPPQTDLTGDIAMAPIAGAVWPMKNWAYYKELRRELERSGLTVNELPRRASLLEHLSDVRNHRCLVGGDSLPMHLALGSDTPCVSLFTCTSPWEIYDYGLQTKIVSPLLAKYFYRRDFEVEATTAIGLDEVFQAVRSKLAGVGLAAGIS